MALEVVWTSSALRDRKAILKYWIDRNGSASYSRKLYKRWEMVINVLATNPWPTRHEGIRVALIGHYNIFYQPDINIIRIVRIMDGRRDLTTLKF